jgi:hypothetical protein
MTVDLSKGRARIKHPGSDHWFFKLFGILIENFQKLFFRKIIIISILAHHMGPFGRMKIGWLMRRPSPTYQSNRERQFRI